MVHLFTSPGATIKNRCNKVARTGAMICLASGLESTRTGAMICLASGLESTRTMRTSVNGRITAVTLVKITKKAMAEGTKRSIRVSGLDGVVAGSKKAEEGEDFHRIFSELLNSVLQIRFILIWIRNLGSVS